MGAVASVAGVGRGQQESQAQAPAQAPAAEPDEGSAAVTEPTVAPAEKILDTGADEGDNGYSPPDVEPPRAVPLADADEGDVFQESRRAFDSPDSPQEELAEAITEDIQGEEGSIAAEEGPVRPRQPVLQQMSSIDRSALLASLHTEEEKDLHCRPWPSQLTQQRLPDWKPLPSPSLVFPTIGVVGAVILALGIAWLETSSKMQDESVRYDQFCIPDGTTFTLDGEEIVVESDVERALYVTNFIYTDEVEGGANNCETYPESCCYLPFFPSANFDKVTYFYYELDNFYQNHRKYVSSRSDLQLRGDDIGATGPCEPSSVASVNGMRIDPCGLVAASLFNDTYTILNATTCSSADLEPPIDPDNIADCAVEVELDTSLITWNTDRDIKFDGRDASNFNNDPATRTGRTIEGPMNQDEGFILWMRTGAMDRFRNIFGRVPVDLRPGEKYVVQISNLYNTYALNGQKKIIFSEVSWIGTKNNAVGIAFIVIGAFYLFTVSLLAMIISVRKRPPTEELFSWNRIKHRPAAAPRKRNWSSVLFSST